MSGESHVAAGGMWGGRFAGGSEGEDAALFRAINDSLPVDWRLVEQDIAGSEAWARALGRAGVLSDDEVARLEGALEELVTEARSLPGPPVESGAEDVHTWVEIRLIDRLGDLGKKLHTGRSRNDQVATDLRLWLKGAIAERVAELRLLQLALIECAERHEGAAFPSFTHLQSAQPILFGHWAMAYVEMLGRDVERLRGALERTDEMPLGCAALAGTAYPIDRALLAKDLGFARPSANSIDAVGDRDFVIETIGALALLGSHLSRFAEDVIVYTSSPFALIELSEDVSSGSSIMPQKKNPDACELIRAKSGVLAGLHASMLSLVKALPTAYNKDLQEDKRAVFCAMDESSLCVRLASACVRGMRVDADRARGLATGGYANATELADWLVGRGVAFRDAHGIVGRLVRLASEQGTPLESLTLEQIRAEAPEADEGVFEALGLESALARRSSLGGTSPDRVRGQIARWRALLVKEGFGVS